MFRGKVKGKGNKANPCVTSGFRRQVDEICALLGYYAAYSDNSLPTFRDNLSVPFSRVMNQERHEFKKDFYSLKMGPRGFPETSVRSYHYTLRNIQEERRSQANPRFRPLKVYASALDKRLPYIYIYIYIYGARGGVVVKALRYKSAGRGLYS